MAGQSAALPVTFTPSATTAGGQIQTGTLTVESDADNSPVTVNLTGTVSQAPATAIFGSACSFQGTPHVPCSFLNFQGVAVGSSAAQTLTVQNTGCPPLTLAATLVQDGGDYALGQVPAQVALGQSAQVTVTFTPSAETNVPGALVFATNDPAGGPGPDAGVYAVTWTGFGAAAVLTLTPPAGAFGSVAPGTTVGQTFEVRNGGTSAIALEPPAVTEADDAGAFALDAGWASGFVLDAGSSVSCVVTADLPAQGAYGGTLVVPYGAGQELSAQLTASAEGSLCATPQSLSLPDAGSFCGSVTGTVALSSCSDGGVPVDIASVAIDPSTNGAGLLSVALPAGGPPWTVSPGGAPVQVQVTFRDDGLRTDYSSQLIVASDAAGQAQLLVPVIPQPVEVPPALGIPVFVDGGAKSGSTFLFQVQPDDSASFAYQFYWLGKGDGGTAIDAGLTPLPASSGADVAFVPDVPGTFKVCVDEVEIDAGFGSCGFDAGNGTGVTGSHCSQTIAVTQ